MLQTMLKERSIPPLLSREEMLEILAREEYGRMPPPPDAMTWTVEENCYNNFCAGKALLSKVHLTCTVGQRSFTFPFYCSIPTAPGKHPFFIHVNFRDCVPDIYMPTEEIIDSGFAILSFCYNDVTRDNRDFTDGLAGVFFPDGKRNAEDPGKISLWAWAAQRVMDYAMTLDCLDPDRSIVCGHSRLGKTALWTAATDERFRFVYSNDSGCSGAAISRGKDGEQVWQIWKQFPFWFCENYRKYAEDLDSMPFDQHYLLASIAPRFVFVGSAEDDEWAGPVSEFLCCAAASPAWEAAGLPGFRCEDRLPQPGDLFSDGTVGYHMRSGPHYFSRLDWQKCITFINKHS